MKKIEYISFALLLSLLACSTNDKTLESGQHATFEAKGATIKENLFALNLDGQSIDEFHRLNPKLFVLTNLTEAKNEVDLVQSTKTGKVYRAVIKKGDLISVPATLRE